MRLAPSRPRPRLNACRRRGGRRAAPAPRSRARRFPTADCRPSAPALGHPAKELRTIACVRIWTLTSAPASPHGVPSKPRPFAGLFLLDTRKSTMPPSLLAALVDRGKRGGYFIVKDQAGAKAGSSACLPGIVACCRICCPSRELRSNSCIRPMAAHAHKHHCPVAPGRTSPSTPMVRGRAGQVTICDALMSVWRSEVHQVFAHSLTVSQTLVGGRMSNPRGSRPHGIQAVCRPGLLNKSPASGAQKFFDITESLSSRAAKELCNL